jgi:hypothetical protein
MNNIPIQTIPFNGEEELLYKKGTKNIEAFDHLVDEIKRRLQ